MTKKSSNKFSTAVRSREFGRAAGTAAGLFGAMSVLDGFIVYLIDRFYGSQAIYDHIAKPFSDLDNSPAGFDRFMAIQTLYGLLAFVVGIVLMYVVYRLVFARLRSKAFAARTHAAATTAAFMAGVVVSIAVSFAAYWLLPFSPGAKENDMVFADSGWAPLVISAVIVFVLIPLWVYFFAKKRAEDEKAQLFS